MVTLFKHVMFDRTSVQTMLLIKFKKCSVYGDYAYHFRVIILLATTLLWIPYDSSTVEITIPNKYTFNLSQVAHPVLGQTIFKNLREYI